MPEPKTQTESPRIWDDLSLLLVAVCWGINAVVLKYGISQIDPYLFNAIRLSISALSLWFCILILEPTKPPTKSSTKQSRWKVIGWLVAFSILSGAVYQITFLIGIFRTTAGNTALIMASCPMWTAIMAVRTTGDRLTRVAWTGLSITLLGTMLVIAQRGEFSAAGATFVGNIIILVAALFWAATSVASKPMLNHTSAIRLAFYAMFLTLPIHWALAIPSLGQWQKACDPWGFAAIFYSGFVSTGVAYAMWNVGIRKVGAPHAAIYQNVIPLVAVVGAWLMIGESPTVLQIAGGVLIIVGLLVMRRSRLKTS